MPASEGANWEAIILAALGSSAIGAIFGGLVTTRLRGQIEHDEAWRTRLIEAVEMLSDPFTKAQGGRPRTYPTFMSLVYGALCSVWRSARQVEAELAHPLVWNFIRELVAARFPDDPSRRLPALPMRRHHFIYMRNRYLTDPAILAAIGDLHRSLATEQARATGLLEADGGGSWTHPSLDRLLHADGKVVTPLFRAKPGDTRVDKRTGEIIPLSP